MKWLKWFGLFLGAIVLILAVVPLFISLDDAIPRIEKEISARIKEPVKIGSLKASGLPLPHLTVTGITVGKTEDIKVGKVTVTPDLFSLLGATKVIKSIEISQLVLTQKGFDKIPAAAAGEGGQEGKGGTPAPAGPPAVRVQSIKLDDATLKLEQAVLGPFDARLELAADGSPVSADIATRDGKLKVAVKPDGSRFLIDASAKGWKPPVGPALQFDELAIKGVATVSDADFPDVRAKLYGGTVAGKLAAAWKSGIQLKGNAEVSQVEIKPLLVALGKPATLSGKLNARPVFSASAAKAGQLAAALRLETPFDVQNGVLHGVDIRKAATSFISKDGGKGGETRFDRLSGHLAMERGTRRLTQLNVASGSLAADGAVTISPRDELSGRINANVKSSVASAGIPLNVTGTVQSPLMYPTGGTVAGAALGTAVAGPLGTGVGAKIGGWTEKLFGGGEKKK
jgi:uncharacterized protein involved in outer membrane biogenesis